MENRIVRNSWRTRRRIITIPAVIRRYARAERALAVNAIAEYEADVRHETPAYLRLNRESYGAGLAVPGWLRWLTALIDWRITRDLDYWHRTGQS